MSKKDRDNSGQKNNQIMRFFQSTDPTKSAGVREQFYQKLSNKEKKIALVSGFRPRKARSTTRRQLQGKNKDD